MAKIKLGGIGPDGFEAGQQVEYHHEQPDGSLAWERATIQWYSWDFIAGEGNWVIRLHDAPSSRDMQSVPFHSDRMRAVP